MTDSGHRPRPGAVDYDAELRRHHEVLRRPCAVQPHEHVLDIGCGSGLTTRDAARTAAAGSALGVDISGSAVVRARELARAEGVGNVAFEQGDAQVHRFAEARFDLAMSRFGTMFFADPVAAFTNIGRALRPGGRLVMMVWQTADRNEWHTLLRDALAAPAADPGPDPFALADPPTVRRVLTAAGFETITFTDVREPVFYGADLAAALTWIRSFTCTASALAHLSPTATTHTLTRLRTALTPHLTPTGIWLPSRTWTITAHRP